MYPLIDLGARTIVRRNHKCAFGGLCILARDGGDAFLMALHFMHAALPVKTFDGGSHLTVCQLLDGLLQLRVALPHDLFQLHRAHSRFLKLRERATRFDGLVLARVTYQKDAVIRMESGHKLVHLAR